MNYVTPISILDCFFSLVNSMFCFTGKRDFGIEEYSFSQSTLEQVFLEFAREQDEDAKDDDNENGTQLPQTAVSA